MNTTVVLGAGGAAGWVFHAGVARTLIEDFDWDIREAGLLIGTSAGAAVAAGLRAGTDPAHIVDSVTRGPSDEERQAYREQVAARKRTYRPLAPGLARHALPGNGGVGIAVAGLLPPGWFPTEPLGRFPGIDTLTEWGEGLWIPAVRSEDGATVVFGRDLTEVRVADAVEASSAVPGIFSPKEIGAHQYLDGGLASPTHAHLAAERPPELVIVSSPMTQLSRRPLARHARRRLDAEKRSLAAVGIDAVVIEPAATDAFRGFPRRNPGAAPQIVELARDATRAALADA